MTSGLDGDGAGDEQALLLAAGQAGAGRVQAVGDLVPQAGALQRALDDVVELGLGVARPWMRGP